MARVTPAVTISASWLRAPAFRLTAVCDVPPPEGMAPRSAPAAFPRPVAKSSRLARGAGSSLRAKARPAATVSVKLISAMPRAPAQRPPARETSGSTTDGKPVGMWPTSSTPRAFRPSSDAPPIPAATATSGAGNRGKKRARPSRIATVATVTASVGSEVSETCARVASRLRPKVPRAMWKPRSFGTWSRTMTTPIPALNPVRTGSEMKLAMKPSRRSEATRRIAPTSSVSVADTRNRAAASPPAATSPNSAPARIAIVVVVLTLNTLEVPSAT